MTPPRRDDTKPPLGLDPSTLESCVQCGLCLPHCPTWRTSGEEVRSPRGRIDAMRSVESGETRLDAGFVDAIESCVGCLACESACPSAVHYGELLDRTQSVLAESAGVVPRWQRLALTLLDRPRVVRAGVRGARVAQFLGDRFGRRPGPLANLPSLRGARIDANSTRNDVVLLTGCVMGPTLPEVHAATVRVLAAAGFVVSLQSDTTADGACCGALAAHRGLDALSWRQIEKLATRLPPARAVLSNSAGCGTAIASASRSESASKAVRGLGERTEEVCSFLLRHPSRLPSAPPGPRPRVAMAVSCHLRNIGGPDAAGAVTELLGRYCDVVETADDDLCCGAGGSHSILRPDEAAAIRARKVDAIDATGADRVASANPGCILHLRAGGVRVSHPLEIIDEVLGVAGQHPQEA
ncbi:MAG: (Fe-S)-binding protein [Microthrixaceae bacterium]